MKKSTIRPLSKTALTAALLLELATTAQAATIDVDNNTCTLADAITAANTDSVVASCSAGSDDDVIELPTDSTITLTTALPAIINNVTINANGSTITRDSSAVDFSVIQVGSAVYIANLPILTLNNATITGGARENNNGGGINTLNSSLILNDSIISDNTGGAITLSGNNNSEINRTIISNNQSSDIGGYYGGALSVNSGYLTLSATTISNNTSVSGLGGGGIYASNYGGSLTINIENSTISGNETTLEGAGIFHYDFMGLSDSDINITSSTIVNNISLDNGGGIHNDVADFIVRQTIISGNTATNDGNEIHSTGGTFTLNDHNLVGLNNDSGSTGVTVGVTDIIPTEANLSEIIDTTLANNGGTTPTHNLTPSSPALDAVLPANCDTTNDQTGNVRGNDGNGDMIDGCDIGAVEFQTTEDDLIFSNGFETPLI